MSQTVRKSPKYNKKQQGQKTKGTQWQENKTSFVVSFRVNNDEKKLLDIQAKNTGVSISNLIRKNLDLSKHDEGCFC